MDNGNTDNTQNYRTIYTIIVTVLLIVITPSLIQYILYPSRTKEEIVLKAADHDIISDSKDKVDINQIKEETIGDNDTMEVESIRLEQETYSLDIAKQAMAATNEKTESSDPSVSEDAEKEIKQGNDSKNKLGSGNGNANNESPKKEDNNWRCVCETGFLPPGMLKNFGSAEAMIRLGTGSCYHKK